MIDSVKYRRQIELLQETLDFHSMPGPYPAVMLRVCDLCHSLTKSDPGLEPVATRLCELAAAFYSRREHLRYPGGAVAIRETLSSLVSQLRALGAVRAAALRERYHLGSSAWTRYPHDDPP